LASNAFTLPFSNVNLLSFGFESNFYALVKRRARTTSMFYMLPFRAKVKKYGDRVLATIEDFLSKHPNPRRNSSGSGSGSNEHTEAAKKRRGFTASYAGSNGEDDFEERSVQTKKRPAKTRSTNQGVSDAASMVYGARCMDADLDGVEVLELDDEQCSVQKPVASGRVLPKWAPAKAKSSSVPPSNLFQEFGYVK